MKEGASGWCTRTSPSHRGPGLASLSRPYTHSAWAADTRWLSNLLFRGDVLIKSKLQASLILGTETWWYPSPICSKSPAFSRITLLLYDVACGERYAHAYMHPQVHRLTCSMCVAVCQSQQNSSGWPIEAPSSCHHLGGWCHPFNVGQAMFSYGETLLLCFFVIHGLMAMYERKPPGPTRRLIRAYNKPEWYGGLAMEEPTDTTPEWSYIKLRHLGVLGLLKSWTFLSRDKLWLKKNYRSESSLCLNFNRINWYIWLDELYLTILVSCL